MIMKEPTVIGNLDEQTLEFSLHVVFSPFLKEHSQVVRQSTCEKATDVQCKEDKDIPIYFPLDGFYHLYILFPAGTISPLLDLAGLEKLHNRTSPV